MCVCACPLQGCARSKALSRVRLSATPWSVARQAPLTVGFSRQEDCRGLPCPPPGDLPDPGMEPWSLMPPALAGGFFNHQWPTREALFGLWGRGRGRVTPTL